MTGKSKREAAMRAEQRATMRKRLMAGGLSVVAAGVLVGGVYVWWANTPPGLPGSLDEATAVYASVRYANLPEGRKADYAQRTQTLLSEATEEQRTAFFDTMRGNEAARRSAWDARRAAMVQRARAYALADEAERQRLLDEMAAEWAAMREAMRAARDGGGDRESMSEEEREQAREQRRQEMVQRIDDYAATGNPQDMRLVRDMMRDMRERSGGGGEGGPGGGGPGRGGPGGGGGPGRG